MVHASQWTWTRMLRFGLSRWNTNLKSPENIWASSSTPVSHLKLFCSGDAGRRSTGLATVCHSVSSTEVLTHVQHTPSPCRRAAWYSPAPGSVASCVLRGTGTSRRRSATRHHFTALHHIGMVELQKQRNLTDGRDLSWASVLKNDAARREWVDGSDGPCGNCRMVLHIRIPRVKS